MEHQSPDIFERMKRFVSTNIDAARSEKVRAAVLHVGAFLLVFLFTLTWSIPARADFPIDVQQKEAEGDYYSAMLAYERMPKRISTTEAIISAAQSAWALSLPDQAIEQYEKALHDKSLPPVERARIEFARGAIEFQEGNPQVAIVFAERAIDRLTDPSPLRGKLWLLWAESLMKLNSVGAAEEKYQLAQKEVGPEHRPEADFLAAQCQLRLGHIQSAIENFARIPLDHGRTPEAIRALAALSLQGGDYSQVSFWLETGRNRFPERFLDSWVDYALLIVAAKEKDIAKVQEIRTAAAGKYPPSDPWLTLLEAKAEAAQWDQRHSEGGRNVSNSK